MGDMNKKHTSKLQMKVRYPDGTVFYNYSKAKRVFASLKPKKFTVQDLILLLLYSQKDKPIHGRIMLFKELFLLYNEVLNKKVIQDPKFVPHRFGPYSYLVGNILNNLIFAGYVKSAGKSNTKSEKFFITEKGRKRIKPLFNALGASIRQQMMERRKGWDQMYVDGILKYVYTHYPRFTERSVLRKRYKIITWGRGRG